MYANVIHQGITIAEWVAIFHGEFSPYELYRMVSEGANLRRMSCTGE